MSPRDQFTEAFSALCPDATSRGNRVFDMLEVRYAEPHRRYHTMEHIASALTEFTEAKHLAERPACVVLALAFHDAIYSTEPLHYPQNEEASAAYAGAAMLQCGAKADDIEYVQKLILDTKHREVPRSPDGLLVVDIDLASLGADDATFERNNRNIRQEFSNVPDEIFYEKNSAFLNGLVGRPGIFYTHHFRRKYELKALANILGLLEARAQ